MRFMFEPLADGTVDMLCKKFKAKGIPYGFGGIASLGKGLLHSEHVIGEHYRLGSTCAILSRSFCNANKINEIERVKEIFDIELQKIRAFEKGCELGEIDFIKNKKVVEKSVAKIVEELRG